MSEWETEGQGGATEGLDNDEPVGGDDDDLGESGGTEDDDEG